LAAVHIYKTLNPAAFLSSFDSLLTGAHFRALCSCFALIWRTSTFNEVKCKTLVIFRYNESDS